MSPRSSDAPPAFSVFATWARRDRRAARSPAVTSSAGGHLLTVDADPQRDAVHARALFERRDRPEQHVALEDVGGEDRLGVARARVDVGQLDRGADRGDLAVLPHTGDDLGLELRVPPAARRRRRRPTRGARTAAGGRRAARRHRASSSRRRCRSRASTPARTSSRASASPAVARAGSSCPGRRVRRRSSARIVPAERVRGVFKGRQGVVCQWVGSAWSQGCSRARC